MNRYQDENWQQEEQRRREAYYRMNSQNSNTPDALEQIFRGPLNWMNLLMIGINVVILLSWSFWGVQRIPDLCCSGVPLADRSF